MSVTSVETCLKYVRLPRGTSGLKLGFKSINGFLGQLPSVVMEGVGVMEKPEWKKRTKYANIGRKVDRLLFCTVQQHE